MDARKSAILQSRYMGPGSPWEKAKARAAQQQMTSDLGSLPEKYTALKGDYGKYSSGNPYEDPTGRCAIDAPSPSGYVPTHRPQEYPSDYGRYGKSAIESERQVGSNDLKDYYCTDPNPALKPPYDFLRQVPGISKDNVALPKQDINAANYGVPVPMVRRSDFEPQPRMASASREGGRIGVEHSMNKSQYGEGHGQMTTSYRSDMQRGMMSPEMPPMRSHDMPLSLDRCELPMRGQEIPKMTPSDLGQDIPMRHPDVPAGIRSPVMPPGLSSPEMVKSGEIPSEMRSPDRLGTGDLDGKYSMDTICPSKDSFPSQPSYSGMSQKDYSASRVSEQPSRHVNFEQLHRPDPMTESCALKGLRRIRTTNQTYGSWIGDPFLEGKNWYHNTPRFPHVKTYLTKHREEPGSWI